MPHFGYHEYERRLVDQLRNVEELEALVEEEARS